MMTTAQHEQVLGLMNTLTALQHRMSRIKNIFPTHHAQLQHHYNQLLLEARAQNMLPPWMK